MKMGVAYQLRMLCIGIQLNKGRVKVQSHSATNQIHNRNVS